MVGIAIVAFLKISLLCGVMCFYLAKVRGRNPWVAFFLGFLFLFPVIIYALLPPVDRIIIPTGKGDGSNLSLCSKCGEIVDRHGRSCVSCGSGEIRRLSFGELEKILESELKGIPVRLD